LTSPEQLLEKLCEEYPVGSFAYQHVMLAADNSAHSNRGVEIGLSIAKAFGSKVTGSHAYAARLHDLRFKQMEGGLPEQYRRESELEKQRETHDTLITHGLEIITDSYLDVVDERALAMGIQLERKSVEGKNYRALLNDIKSSDYDLVVLGAQGLGAVLSSSIGSVCERIVRRADCDVLVARDPKRGIGDGPIMVAVDGSSQAYAGLKSAILLGRHLGVDVEVVSAFDPYFHYVAFNSIAGVLSDEAGEVFRFKEQEKLHEEIIDSGLAKIYQAHLAVSEKVAHEDDAEVTSTLLAGKPYEVILRHIKKRNPSLLVLGKTGVHADAELDIGSNTENLLRLAPCHLLITTREFTPRAEQIAEETTAWTDEAEARMGTVPEHVCAMARMAIIRYAQDHGHTVISTRIVDEAVENLLPADAMAAMGLITQAAKKRQEKRVAEKAEKEAFQLGAEQTFDERVVFWGEEAKQELEAIEDVTTRGHIKLRAEKLALSEKCKTITASLLRRVTGVEPTEKSWSGKRLWWGAEAMARIGRVPEGFMRDASKVRIEDYARREGFAEITLGVCEAGLAEARCAMMQAMQAGEAEPAMESATEVKTAAPEWSEEAESKLVRDAPEGFARDLTRQRIEAFARRKGLRLIDIGLMEEKYAQWGEMSSTLYAELEWEPATFERIQCIPDFVRPMVAREIERYAREVGASTVTQGILNKVSEAWSRQGLFNSDDHPIRYRDNKE